jgi:hypothetical protein
MVSLPGKMGKSRIREAAALSFLMPSGYQGAGSGVDEAYPFIDVM